MIVGVFKLKIRLTQPQLDWSWIEMSWGWAWQQDMIIQYKLLQEKNEELEKQVRNLEAQQKARVESILLLEETVGILEKRSVKKISIGAQTEIIRCEECEYPAECMNDLVYHMFECHPLDAKEPTIKCNSCDDSFTSKRDLMFHKKRDHIENVQICTNIRNGDCSFGNECWFRHDINSTESPPEYNCNFCEETFKTKSEFMKHKKIKHFASVKKCENDLIGTCQYNYQKCWFIHKNSNVNSDIQIDTNMEDEDNEKYSMIKELKDMVENYTERIIKLENEIRKFSQWKINIHRNDKGILKRKKTTKIPKNRVNENKNQVKFTKLKWIIY